MPGVVITFGNSALCTHGGKATPFPPAGRVVISQFGAFTLSHRYAIVGCGLPAATLGAQPPCVLGQYVSGTMRVTSMGLPLAVLPESVSNSQGLPNATPLIVTPLSPAQARVIAS